MGSGRSNPGHTTVVPEIVSVGEVHASGHREVVQLGQGLWFHRPGRRLGRRLRPPLHHQDRRLPYPSGEPAGRVHRWPRPEGPAGGRSAPAVTRHDTSSCGAVLRDRPAVLFTGGRPPGTPCSAVHGGTTPWHPLQCCSRGDDPPGTPRSAVHGGTTPLAPPAVLFTGGRPPWHPPQCCSRGDDPPGTPRSAVHGGTTPAGAVLGHRAGDGDEPAVVEVGVSRLGGVPGQLDAAQALVPAVAVPIELVHRIAAVEVGRVVHRVVVLASVRVRPLHVAEVVLQVD